MTNLTALAAKIEEARELTFHREDSRGNEVPLLHTLETDFVEGDPGQIVDPVKAFTFVLGGNATFTARSKKTGTRYTFKVRKGKNDDAPHFVSVMFGSDNESDFVYLGTIFRALEFRHGRKSTLQPDDIRVKAFTWIWNSLSSGKIPADLEIWHEGRCGRCNRKLTVPESVSTGFGPECVKHIH